LRILVTGGPKVGKTTFAEELSNGGDPPVFHGDDLIGSHDWSKASEEISHWFDRTDDWIIEGVQVARALRKWFARNPTGLPADSIYHSNTPFVELNKGQAAMLKGHETVWNELQPEIAARGLPILRW
jgi:hypothetical protein